MTIDVDAVTCEGFDDLKNLRHSLQDFDLGFVAGNGLLQSVPKSFSRKTIEQKLGPLKSADLRRLTLLLCLNGAWLFRGALETVWTHLRAQKNASQAVCAQVAALDGSILMFESLLIEHLRTKYEGSSSLVALLRHELQRVLAEISGVFQALSLDSKTSTRASREVTSARRALQTFEDLLALVNRKHELKVFDFQTPITFLLAV